MVIKMNENFTDEQKYSLMNFSRNFKTRPSDSNKGLSRLFSGLSVGVYFLVNYIVAVILSFIAVGILVVLESTVNINLDTASIYLNSILNTLIYIILFLSLLPFLIKAIVEDFKKICMKNYLIFAIVAFIIFLLIIMVYNVTIQEVLIQILLKTKLVSLETLKAYSASANQQGINQMLSDPFSAIISIPVLVVLGPIAEELVFRKALFRLFNFKHNIFNILITAFLFGMIHVSTAIFANLSEILLGNISYGFQTTILEIVYLGSYCLPGFLLGVIYSITGNNIYPVILVHIFNNAFAVLLTYIQI